MKNELKLQMPEPDSNGFYKTMNNTGFMSPILDEIATEFVTFSIKESHFVVLDIGCAYGLLFFYI